MHGQYLQTTLKNDRSKIRTCHQHSCVTQYNGARDTKELPEVCLFINQMMDFTSMLQCIFKCTTAKTHSTVDKGIQQLILLGKLESGPWVD